MRKRLRITGGLWLLVALVISTWSKEHSPVLDFRLPPDFGSFAFYSPDGETIMAFSEQPESGMVTLDFWSAVDGHKIRSAVLYPSRITRAILSPDGQFLITRHYDRFIRVTDLRSETVETRFQSSGRIDDEIAYSPQQDVIATTFSGGVAIWDLNTGTQIKQFHDEFNRSFSNIVFNPDGDYLAYAGSEYTDSKLCLWKVASDQDWQCIHFSDGIFSLAWSPDGQYIALGGSGRVNIWDVRQQKVVRQLPTAGFFVIGYIGTINFSPDGKFLAAAGSDTYWVAIWDTRDWERPIQFGDCGTAPCGYSEAVYNPNGRSILIEGGDRWESFTEQWTLPRFLHAESTR